MKRNFPSFIQAFLDYSKNVGAPEKFLLWSAISGVAAALERKTWVHYNGIQVIYPNLYVMLIAESGIAKKSTATRTLAEILYGVEGISYMSTQLSAASLVQQLNEAGSKKSFEFDNVKYKNSSLFAYSSEAKVTIGSKNGLEGIQELLTDFYDCGDPNIWSTTKGWNKKTLSGGNITVFNPCLNFLACSTPAWLNEAIGRSGIEGGFASRVLFINQKERSGNATGWLDEDEYKGKDLSNIKKLLIEDLSQIHALQGRYKTQNGWKPLFNDIQNEVNFKLDQAGEMKSYYSRKMWHLIKLSQILAADQSNDLILTPDHLLAAKGLLESIEDEMYSAFQMKGENKNLSSFVFVWEVMRKKPLWKKKDIISSTYRHATTAQLDEHLRTLHSMGRIQLITAEGGVFYKVIDPNSLDHKT